MSIRVKMNLQIARIWRNWAFDFDARFTIRTGRFDDFSRRISLERIHLILHIDPERCLRASTQSHAADDPSAWASPQKPDMR